MEPPRPPPGKATAPPAPWAGCCPIKGPSTSPWSSRRLRRGTSRATTPDTRSTGEGGCVFISACLSGVTVFVFFFFSSVFFLPPRMISLMSTLSRRGTNQGKAAAAVFGLKNLRSQDWPRRYHTCTELVAS